MIEVKLRKNAKINLRMSQSLKDALAADNISPQKLFDAALAAYFDIWHSPDGDLYIQKTYSPELKVEGAARRLKEQTK